MAVHASKSVSSLLFNTETFKHKILPANYYVSSSVSACMMDGAFNVLLTLWSDGDSSFLDSSGPSVFRSVCPSRPSLQTKTKRERAAAFAWRNPNSNLIVCHVCNWIKGTEKEGMIIEVVVARNRVGFNERLFTKMWLTGRGAALKKKTHVKSSEDVSDTDPHCYVWQPVVNPSIVISAMTEMLWQSVCVRFRTDLCVCFS